MYTYEESLASSLEYFNQDELAAKVVVDKYLLRNNEDVLLEKNPTDIHRRHAKEFARIEVGKFKDPFSEEEIFELFDHYKYICVQGSPTFGIGNDYQITSLSNCYVCESPVDSYGGILKADEELIQISKRRGGVGLDLSKLRPKGSPTKNAARSSTGIVSWMERYSNSIREVGQSARRGALMITLDIGHPDALDFIKIKNDPLKVTGANISVRLSDKFMESLDSNPKAKNLWKETVDSAWKRAEPGVLFWDRICEYNAIDCYEEFKTVSTNPCCFAISKDIFIKTNNGIKEIKTVTKDDLVYIPDAFTTQWVKQSGYFKSGIADIYKVCFSNNDIFYITLNHKLAVMGDYGEILDLKTLSELNIGDEILCDKGDLVEINSIEYYSTEEVGCINVPNDGFFTTASGIISGNSELPLCAYDSCRLMFLNLLSYVIDPFTKKARFDNELFWKHTIIAQRLMDDLIDLELEKIDKILDKIKSDPEDDNIKCRELQLWENIKDKCQKGRRTGLGVTAWGDTLAALGIKYGSDDSIDFVGGIHGDFKCASFHSSANMAKELGPFPVWDWEKEKDSLFLLEIKKDAPFLYEKIKKYGRRNIGNLTIAPVGTMSILTQTTSGIEPVFELEYKRRKKINHNDDAKPDFIDPSGDKWLEFIVSHPGLAKWKEITGETDTTKSPYWGCTANEIDWTARVKLQAAAQKHIDHSISSTINLPENVSREEVANIYLTAWKSGCKGMTVYRNNCRTGVLISESNNKIPKTNAPDRPSSLPCKIFYPKRKGGLKFVIVVGMLNDDPYEVFGWDAFNGEVPDHITEGTIKRIANGHYKLLKDDQVLIENIGDLSDPDQAAINRLISSSLRHGMDVKYLAAQLSKVRGNMYDLAAVLARTLKRFIPDNVATGEKCPNCEAELKYTEGCKSCSKCGWSKC